MEKWIITPAGACLTRAIRVLATATALGVGWVILGAVTSASAEEIPQDASAATQATSILGTLTSTIVGAESDLGAVVAATLPVVSVIAQPLHELAEPILEALSGGLPIPVTAQATDLAGSAIPHATSADSPVTTATYIPTQSWAPAAATPPIAMAPSLALVVTPPDTSPFHGPGPLTLFGGAGSLASTGGASASASVALLLGAAFTCALALGTARLPRNIGLPISISLLPGTSPA